MPRAVPLVDDPADVSVPWLDGVLSGAGVAPAGRLEGLDATSVGTGKVGEIVRFDLEWGAEGDGPASVIGKFASPDETSRQAGLLTGTYVREVSFYRHLAHTVGLKVPDCYGVELDPSTGGFVLVLEDLRPARQGDQIEGCTVDEAALAMEELPGLHAPHWGGASLADQDWLTVRSGDAGGGLAMLYDSLVDAFVGRYGDRLAPEVVDAVRRFTGRVPAWIGLDAEPFTLLHSDYRLENLLFGEGDAAFSLAVVDWQTVAVGPALSDVAYFLGAGLPVEQRRAHERDLVGTYRDALAARGVEVSLDRSWDEYRRHTFAGLHMTVVASQLVGQEERSDAMFCAMAERHATHVLDLDAFDLLD